MRNVGLERGVLKISSPLRYLGVDLSLPSVYFSHFACKTAFSLVRVLEGFNLINSSKTTDASFPNSNMGTQMSKETKFVADGVFFAELNEVLTRELAEDGYSGTFLKGRKIRELTSAVQKRFNFPENSVELYAEKVNNRGLCAIAQASLRYKLLGGLAVRRRLPGERKV
ncbi:small ribosomal subunit protein uS3z-like isoform X2 [Tasmannia lanceolata]|uniref:small ribosomal subunit protein uS3z-like isoform X2 n=1 Tax=Tasmannia lanceolata TaxID=3420 RepID=UPI0040637E7D